MVPARQFLSTTRIQATSRAIARFRDAAHGSFFRWHAPTPRATAALDVALVTVPLAALTVISSLIASNGLPDIIRPAEANVPVATSVIARTPPVRTLHELGLRAAVDTGSVLFAAPSVVDPDLQALAGAPVTGRFAGGDGHDAVPPASPPEPLLTYTGVAGEIAR
jgi:hypothetical protein